MEVNGVQHARAVQQAEGLPADVDPLLCRMQHFPPGAGQALPSEVFGNSLDKKRKTLIFLRKSRSFLAEKEGFEPSLRLSHTTPLAGEPLRPLGYFSKLKTKYSTGAE